MKRKLEGWRYKPVIKRCCNVYKVLSLITNTIIINKLSNYKSILDVDHIVVRDSHFPYISVILFLISITCGIILLSFVIIHKGTHRSISDHTTHWTKELVVIWGLLEISSLKANGTGICWLWSFNISTEYAYFSFGYIKYSFITRIKILGTNFLIGMSVPI